MTRGQIDADTIRLEAKLRTLMPRLLGYFHNRLDDREDAADALADTMLVLWRRRRSIPRDDVDLARWAFGVARKVLANARRGKLRRSQLSAELTSVLPHAISQGIQVDLDLRRGLEALSEDDREIIVLVAWEGLPVIAAAKILGINADSARARYSRARARLRELL